MKVHETNDGSKMMRGQTTIDEKAESNPVTNISVTNNYNTISGVSTERKDEENENKDAQTTIDEKALEIAALKINKEYEEKVASSTNEELIEAIEVWKIYKLLQRMKTKEVSTGF